ncbi:hypothetical protein RDV64_06620 [Acuticoccus sp. MNP-M23]|uniref:hypothetical protein n=1 Tax=Acuticoccus sp. MNP-M23 TaxID=3072793 RepID=UPI0028150AFB|nr:hypothetical protein [Acuticoccus sp. MNP-M23]WMS44059.1 hypothetical protein RDV64_06620 [Acuticoccus sp. MNP-M23]
MTPLDWVLSLLGLSGLIAFVGIIAVFVPEPALLAVIGITVMLAVYDFWVRPLLHRHN